MISRSDIFKNDYFEWMYNLVCNDDIGQDVSNISYRKLLMYLHGKSFMVIIPMDQNRVRDGVDLRYIFADEVGYSQQDVDEAFPDRNDCSILELMIALSLRCEDNIMFDYDLGNRVGQWFWSMIVSLGFGGMTDNHFNRQYADGIVSVFLTRSYKKNGEGGLFTISDKSKDMRTIEIWYQMCFYLNELIEENN